MLAAQVTDNSYKGWQASLALQFCHTPEKTLLHSAHHVGPLTVQRPFYPEGETCHLYLLHPPGGVVGGDRLDITVRLDAKSHALITMPGASKFYRSSGPQARLHQHFYLDEGSTLEWLPQDTIIFPGANAALRSIFHLKASSTLLAWELYCLGRPVINEIFSHGTLESRLEVWVEDDQLSEALKTLTEKKRNIILLSYFMDMSDSEISEFIKIPRSNVQYHRTKTLEAMRKIMEERK